MIIIRILFCLCLLISLPTHALNLKSWFENTNQRAARFMAEANYEAAEKTFTRADWQAVAAYRGQHYEKAADYFKQLDDEQSLYNYGNTLAQSKQYQPAIDAYEKALKHNPNNQDALYNRDLVKKLLEKQQNQNQNQTDQNKNKQNQDKSKQDQNKSQQDQDKAQDKAENKKEEKAREQQAQQDQSKSQQDQEQKQHNQSQTKPDQDQALRLVPDDPGGLLREKFWRDHWRRTRALQ